MCVGTTVLDTAGGLNRRAKGGRTEEDDIHNQET